MDRVMRVRAEMDRHVRGGIWGGDERRETVAECRGADIYMQRLRLGCLIPLR